MSERTKTRLGLACVLISLAFIALWFIGQEVSADPTLDVPGIVANLYPGSWPEAARGVLWLLVGVTAVGFDLLIVYPNARTRFGRTGLIAAGAITGLSFLIFAVGSFVGAPWSLIH